MPQTPMPQQQSIMCATWTHDHKRHQLSPCPTKFTPSQCCWKSHLHVQEPLHCWPQQHWQELFQFISGTGSSHRLSYPTSCMAHASTPAYQHGHSYMAHLISTTPPLLPQAFESCAWQIHYPMHMGTTWQSQMVPRTGTQVLWLLHDLDHRNMCTTHLQHTDMASHQSSHAYHLVYWSCPGRDPRHHLLNNVKSPSSLLIQSNALPWAFNLPLLAKSLFYYLWQSWFHSKKCLDSYFSIISYSLPISDFLGGEDSSL